MHEVKIKVMAGASAGGMTAGLAAGLLGMQFQSVTAQPPPDQPSPPVEQQPLPELGEHDRHRAAARRRDLDGNGDLPVQSVLDSSILLDIADNAFRFERPDDRATGRTSPTRSMCS